MYKNKSVCLVIPCLNEEEGVVKTLENLPAVIDEVIVVDNNSTDRTAAVAQSMGARVVYEARRGYGYAYKKGFEVAESDIIVTSDGDNTYPMHAVESLLKAMDESNLDFITVKREYEKLPCELYIYTRILGNVLLSFITRVLFNMDVFDSQSGMWVFKRDILKKIKLSSNDMSFSEEIKIRAFIEENIKSREIAVEFLYLRRAGESKLSVFRHGVKNLTYQFYLKYSCISRGVKNKE